MLASLEVVGQHLAIEAIAVMASWATGTAADSLVASLSTDFATDV